jgi:hypothetical protein
MAAMKIAARCFAAVAIVAAAAAGTARACGMSVHNEASTQREREKERGSAEHARADHTATGTLIGCSPRADAVFV